MCNINTFVSIKYNGLECNKWYTIDMYVFGECNLPFRVDPYNDSDYIMFGVLAGVCHKTDNGKFVCHQFGIDCDTPEDVRYEYIEMRDIDTNDDVHDIGHVTLDELKAAYHNKADFTKIERKSLKPLISGIEFMRDAAGWDVADPNVRLDFFFEG